MFFYELYLLIFSLLVIISFILVFIRLNNARYNQEYIIKLNHEIIELLKEKQGK